MTTPSEQEYEHFSQEAHSSSVHEYFTSAHEAYQDWAERYPFAATTVETLAVIGVRLGIRRVGDKLDKNLGNAFTADPNHTDQALDHALFFAAAMIGAMPVIEELGSRALPNALANKQRARGNDLAAKAIEHAAQIGFAAWHTAYIRPEPKFNPFGVTVRIKNAEEESSFPVSQFVAGEHLMRIYKKRGLCHAIGAHALNNFVALAASGVKEARHIRAQDPAEKITVKALIQSARNRRRLKTATSANTT